MVSNTGTASLRNKADNRVFLTIIPAVVRNRFPLRRRGRL